MIGVSAASMACIVAGTVVMYVYYTHGTGCGLNIFFITFNLIIGIVLMAASVLPKVQQVRSGRSADARRRQNSCPAGDAAVRGAPTRAAARPTRAPA